MNAPARSLAPSRARGGRATELRCSYIWRQEVMGDVVATAGMPVTLGHGSGGTTFVTPRLGLPDGFAILRPGNRGGWVLTLGTGMTGRLRIADEEREVADFVARGGGAAEGSFRATPVGPGDWGVIELDGNPDHVFFFQFVDTDPPIPPPLLLVGPLMVPALVFAILLHGIFVTVTYLIPKDNPFVYPGDRELLSAYLIKRPPEEELVEEKKEKDEAQAGKEEEKKEVKEPARTQDKEGRSGGRGERRSTAPDPRKGQPDKPVPKVAFLDDQNRKTLEEVAEIGGFDEDFGETLARLKRNQRMAGDSGHGRGSGTGYGDEQGGVGNTRGSDGTGSGGGGRSPDEIASTKGMKGMGERAGHGAGGSKPREVKVTRGEASGDFTGLTKADVDKVIKAAAGGFRACYQDALNRSPDLAGKVVVRFVIKDDSTGPRGAGVTRASLDRGASTIGNSAVENCVVGKIKSLRFPAKGGAIVNYPFIFSNG